MKAKHAFTAALAASLLVAGCGSNESTVRADPAAVPYAIDQSRSNGNNFSSLGEGADTIPELLPNRLFRGYDPEMKPVWVPASDSVILGTPISVEPDAAEDWSSEAAREQDGPTKVDFLQPQGKRADLEGSGES